MKTCISFVLAGLAITFAFAAPIQAQDVAKEEGEASTTEMMESHNEMKGEGEGEGCQCSCMQEMHEKMMKMHGDAEGHAEGMDHDDADAGHSESEGHAEGMDSDEGHAEMMAAHEGMMEGCKCMSGEMGEGEMSCKMHDAEGMEHEHGMEHGDSDEEESDERR